MRLEVEGGAHACGGIVRGAARRGGRLRRLSAPAPHGWSRDALRRLGLPAPVHLPFPEAPHRGYASAPELFARPREDDVVAGPLAAALAPQLDGAALVMAPLGLGGHVDHLQVLAALGERALVRWHDLPYALRDPGPPDAPIHPASACYEPAKLGACAAYASQLGFQFGGEAGMREALGGVPARFDEQPT